MKTLLLDLYSKNQIIDYFNKNHLVNYESDILKEMLLAISGKAIRIRLPGYVPL
jgi:hypothetical protein